MLLLAFVTALLLGLAAPTLAARREFSFRNVTGNGTVQTEVETKLHATPAGTGYANNHTLRSSSSTQTPTATFVNTAPSVTLSPNVHWSYDTKAVKNVIPIEPKQGSELYYGVSDPSKSGHYAFLKYHFSLPSVNLDHTEHVTVKHDPGKGMIALFNNDDTFKRAMDTWPSKGGLILIAYTEGCGDYANRERCYFNVTGLEYNLKERSIVAKGSSKHPDQITTSGETEWGWWSAGNKKESQAHASATASDEASGSTSSAASSSENPGSNGFAVAGRKNRLMGESDCPTIGESNNGLVTACLGPTFDHMLDQKLGYGRESSDSKKFLEDMLYGHSSSAYFASSTVYHGAKRIRRQSPVKRPVLLPEAFYNQAAETTSDIYLSGESIGGTIDHGFSFKLPDPASVHVTAKTVPGNGTGQAISPWGDAVLLKSFQPERASKKKTSYLRVYCVGCGVSGHARVAGRARWSPFRGLEEGRVELNVNIKFVLKLGIEARHTLKHDFSSELFSYGLPGLSYGIITIGPYVSVGARVGFDATAKGKILAGAEMGLQDALVVIDIVDPSQNRRSGWKPYFKPVFEADGELTLSAEMGLPVGIKCGLKILRWEKAVGIIDEPSVKGSAQTAGQVALTDSGKVTAGFKGNCIGIMTQLSWRHRLWAGITDRLGDPMLDTGDRAVFRKCIGETIPAPQRNRTSGMPSHIMKIPKKKVQQRRTVAGPENALSDSTGLSRLRYDMATAPTELYNNSNNSNNTLSHRLSQLLNPTASAKVVSCANGNLYVVRNDNRDNENCFELWHTTRHSEVVYDVVQRSLHYYSDTMSKLGVSRLRASNEDEVPRTSVPVAFVPPRNPKGQDLYVAVNHAQEVFYPIVCDYGDRGASKVFVAKDPIQGVEVLQRKDVVYSVTGGAVSKCRILALKA
ncbi:hypothetical protein QQS21_012134 [Conoideocrella luteorostrata]|uniref:DUF7029 domain-containing protein n=1 Tax=Conoideocrella luteorostrata TaxID=1105319 RepID=A0AAJ0CBR1_9HYPO|nr:hypothetical protein QQS21_012134 [Conoideocrella luteorostrata]